MPSLPSALRPVPTAASKAEFRRELAAIVAQHRMDPSIVVWVPFNEGWAQFDVGAISRQVKRLDPSALVDVVWIPAGAASVRVMPRGDLAVVVDGAGRVLLVDLKRIDESSKVDPLIPCSSATPNLPDSSWARNSLNSVA